MSDTKEVRADDSDAADSKGATENQVQRIQEIHGNEVLGYQGEGNEEHTGQSGGHRLDPTEDLADNDDVPR